jgi:hypothetical protein
LPGKAVSRRRSCKETALTYVPYPAGTGDRITEPLPRPRSLATAVKLMYAGAALAVLNVIVSIAMQHTLPIAAGGIIAAGAWLWMARENAVGRGWARTLAAVLFGIYTLASLLVLSTQGLGVTIVGFVNWLVALAATICLWRRDASQYFTQSRYQEAAQDPAQSRYF